MKGRLSNIALSKAKSRLEKTKASVLNTKKRILEGKNNLLLTKNTLLEKQIERRRTRKIQKQLRKARGKKGWYNHNQILPLLRHLLP